MGAFNTLLLSLDNLENMLIELADLMSNLQFSSNIVHHVLCHRRGSLSNFLTFVRQNSRFVVGVFKITAGSKK